MDSIYPEIDTNKLGNRVQWTRFPCIETEFIELGLYTQKSSTMNSVSIWKPSSLNLVSIHGNRVHWTRFPCLIHLIPTRFLFKHEHHAWNNLTTVLLSTKQSIPNHKASEYYLLFGHALSLSLAMHCSCISYPMDSRNITLSHH